MTQSLSGEASSIASRRRKPYINVWKEQMKKNSEEQSTGHELEGWSHFLLSDLQRDRSFTVCDSKGGKKKGTGVYVALQGCTVRRE
ncbi:hypothetical protein CDAR_182401 [Caerostris darwini]|uniref:Uncharacterized protein n=1 Tax=Caerostris darwini TaxID=1538125 RepID=A0AAV4U5G1_9ARAC|nr:hypothetical protein CDAR_182401 [Caerostris darwini]